MDVAAGEEGAAAACCMSREREGVVVPPLAYMPHRPCHVDAAYSSPLAVEFLHFKQHHLNLPPLIRRLTHCLRGLPYAEFLHVKPGKGAAFVRSKLKNFITNNTVRLASALKHWCTEAAALVLSHRGPRRWTLLCCRRLTLPPRPAALQPLSPPMLLQVDKTWRAGETVDIANIEKKETQFTYAEGDEYVFMDMESYEETRIPKDEDWAK